MKKIVGGILGVAALIFFFQNCGKAGFENQDFESDLSSSTTLDSRQSKLPFPYTVSVNQIAHMTCTLNNAASDTSPYFSWRVGAFDNPSDVPSAGLSIRPSGLQVSDSFKSAWSTTAPTYASTVRTDRLKETLMGQAAVVDTRLQLSLRKTNTPRVDLMQMPTGGNSPSTMFMPTISSEEVATNFTSNLDGIFNIFPNVTDFSNRFLEATLNVPSAYGSQDAALRANYDSSFLTIGFLKPATDPAASSSELSSPGTDDRYAYGKGYRIHYGITNPHTGTTQYPSSDSLAVIEEYDLESGNRTMGVGWDCSYKFKIVRPADRSNPMYKANHFALQSGSCPTQPVMGDYCASPVDNRFGIAPSFFPGAICPSNRPLVKNTTHCEEQYYQTCPQEPYSADLNHVNVIERDDGVYHPSHPERPAILHALRRFLPAQQWDINVSRKCIVPKYDDNSCYQSQKVIYDESFFPGTQANLDLGQYAGCGVAGQYPCAAYLTLCIRR
jgi:hypothetical protein